MSQFFNRFFLFLFSLAVGVCAIVILLAGLSVIDESVSLNAVRDAIDIAWLNNTVIIVSFVLILLSLRFLYVSVKVNNPRKRSYHQATSLGDILISIETIENLALKAASTVRGVKDIKTKVKITQPGLEIVIRVIVDGVHSIPELTEEIQRQVTKEVNEITGIQVANVSVFVANIIQNPSIKRRVE
jgi:uncharacterized alkaline shock family protein YloU